MRPSPDGILWLVTFAALLAWYLSYTAARLDRLHSRVEGSLSALDAQLIRRAEASLELANSGALDPASALLIASAASDALEAGDEVYAGREAIESDLTEALAAALTPEVVALVDAENDGDGSVGAEVLGRVLAAGQRVQLARRFHNDAVTDVRRVRRKAVVRLLRLAGHADLPRTVEFDDALPRALLRA